LQLEAGVDHTRQEGGPAGSLYKVTLAPQLTPRTGVLQRPSIRAYVTWARWSEGFVSLVAPINYGDARQGLGAGVQLETWW
jgi:maltoporin